MTTRAFFAAAALAALMLATSIPSSAQGEFVVRYQQSYRTGTNRAVGPFVREGFTFSTTIKGDFSAFDMDTPVELIIGDLDVFKSLGTAGTTEEFATIGEALDLAGKGYVSAHVYVSKGRGTLTGFFYREVDDENGKTIKTPLLKATLNWNKIRLRVTVAYGEYYFLPNERTLTGIPFDLSVITQKDSEDGRTFPVAFTDFHLTFGDDTYEPVFFTDVGTAFFTADGALARAFIRY